MISADEAAARKRKIKLSAYTLFQEKGVDSVTFGDIAAHSGISESSVYRYFPQKSILLMELHKYLWREIATELKRRTLDIPTFREADGYHQVELLMEAFEQIHLTCPEYLKFALECKLYWIRKQQVVNREEYNIIMEPIMKHFTNALRKGMSDQSICLQADFDSCSFLLWGILRSYIEQMVVLDMLHAEKSSFSNNIQAFKKMLITMLHN